MELLMKLFHVPMERRFAAATGYHSAITGDAAFDLDKDVDTISYTVYIYILINYVLAAFYRAIEAG